MISLSPLWPCFVDLIGGSVSSCSLSTITAEFPSKWFYWKSNTKNVNQKLNRIRFKMESPIQIDLSIFKRKLTFAVRLDDDFFVAPCLLSKWKISRCVAIHSSNIFYKIHVELFIVNKPSKLLTWLSAICLLVEVNSKRLEQGLLEKGLPVSLYPFYH